MVYDLNANAKEIGARIKKCRKASGFKAQEKFAEKMNLSFKSRTSIGNWEIGKSQPNLHQLLELCEIFDCEVGYLLCEHEGKTKEETDVQEVTGLSKESMERLKVTKHIEPKYLGEVSSDLINFILSNDEFWGEFNKLLPIYIKYKSNTSALELDMIKYSLFNMFEGLINELCDYLSETSPQKPLSDVTVNFLERTRMKLTKSGKGKTTKK